MQAPPSQAERYKTGRKVVPISVKAKAETTYLKMAKKLSDYLDRNHLRCPEIDALYKKGILSENEADLLGIIKRISSQVLYLNGVRQPRRGCWYSQIQLGNFIGVTRNTIRKYLKKLLKLGYIKQIGIHVYKCNRPSKFKGDIETAIYISIFNNEDEYADLDSLPAIQEEPSKLSQPVIDAHAAKQEAARQKAEAALNRQRMLLGMMQTNKDDKKDNDSGNDPEAKLVNSKNEKSSVKSETAENCASEHKEESCDFDLSSFFEGIQIKNHNLDSHNSLINPETETNTTRDSSNLDLVDSENETNWDSSIPKPRSVPFGKKKQSKFQIESPKYQSDPVKFQTENKINTSSSETVNYSEINRNGKAFPQPPKSNPLFNVPQENKMSFFSQEKLQSKKNPPKKSKNIPTSEFDRKCTLQFRKALEIKGKISHKLGSCKSWDIQFAVLRRNHDESKIKTVLDWYCDNLGDKFIPEAFSAKAFRFKFESIESAIGRTEEMKSTKPKKEITAKDLNKAEGRVFDAIKNYHWKGDVKVQLPTAIRQTLLNQHKLFLIIARDLAFNELNKKQKSKFKALHEWIKAAQRYPAGFGMDWFESLYNRVGNWDDWNGDIYKSSFNVMNAKHLAKILYPFATSYGSDAQEVLSDFINQILKIAPTISVSPDDYDEKPSKIVEMTDEELEAMLDEDDEYGIDDDDDGEFVPHDPEIYKQLVREVEDVLNSDEDDEDLF